MSPGLARIKPRIGKHNPKRTERVERRDPQASEFHIIMRAREEKEGVVATQPWQKRRLEVGGYGLDTGTQNSHVFPPALYHCPATDTTRCSSRHTVTMVTLRTWARGGLCEDTEEQGDFLAFLCGFHWATPGLPAALGSSPNSPLLNSL